MFKKTISICLALILALSLTACGHEHEWAEANCLTPKTCSSCNETEGEALGHTWADATCAAPKTCSACGTTEGEELEHTWADATCAASKTCSICNATEGEALEHTWIDANYQQPKTCSACNATEGEALVSYFAEHGLDAKLLDKSGEYELELLCPDETSTTIAKVTVKDYQTIESDEAHAAADGYEWKIMTIKLRYSDENAQAQGFIPQMYMWYDKYTDGAIGEGIDNSVNEDLFDAGIAQTFNWNGVEYTDGLLHIAESVGTWEKDDAGAYYIDFTVIVSVRVPVGYDGFVFALEKSNFEAPAGSYLHEVITDNTLLFCMD